MPNYSDLTPSQYQTETTISPVAAGYTTVAGGFGPVQRVVKRIIDLGFSVLILLITLPVCLVLAVAIKLSGKGPVLFRQERVGRHGKLFTLLKFRTMHVGAEPNGPMLSDPNDPRVTGVGRYMRRHKLDELPNFLNVIMADMSVVGPRPERLYYLNELRKTNPEVDRLLTVRPGITGPGQVEYGYASDIDQMRERLVYEISYVKDPSLPGDFAIMWKTALLLLRGRKEKKNSCN